MSLKNFLSYLIGWTCVNFIFVQYRCLDELPAKFEATPAIKDFSLLHKCILLHSSFPAIVSRETYGDNGHWV